MLDAVQRFFQQHLEPVAAGRRGTPQIEVATCALLLEVAHADDEFTAEERAVVLAQLQGRFQLATADAERLVELAEQERRESHGLYQFARLINENYDHAEKLAVLEEFWNVVYSDHRLEHHEDVLMHKLAHLLGLRHEELIALKLRAKGAGGGAEPAGG